MPDTIFRFELSDSGKWLLLHTCAWREVLADDGERVFEFFLPLLFAAGFAAVRVVCEATLDLMGVKALRKAGVLLFEPPV